MLCGDGSAPVIRARSDRPSTADHEMPSEVEDGRRDVNETRRIGDHTGQKTTSAPDDERHAHRRVVREQAVGALAVVTEPFAMIRRDHDERAIEASGALQIVEHPAKRGIRVRDFAVVRRRRILRRKRFRRRIRLVRIVQVDPREPRRGSGANPRGGTRRHLFCRPFDDLDAADRRPLCRTGRRTDRIPARARSARRARTPRRTHRSDIRRV